MDAVDIVKVCARRWYVMLPILVGAAGVSNQLAGAQETTYTAAASYGLVQPSLGPGGRDAEGNPLGSAGDILVGAALEAQLNSRETQERLGGGDTRGWGPGEVASGRSFVVRIPQFETTYEVRAWGEDEQEVRDVVERVIAAAPDITDELQIRANVPPAQRYRPFVLAPTQVEALPSSGWVKLVLAVMGVGLLMGAAWSVVVDRLLQWRRAKRQTEGPSGVAAPAREVGDHQQVTGTDPAHARRPAEPDPNSDNASAKGRLNVQANVRAIGRSNGHSNGQSNGPPNGRANGKSTSAPGRKPSNRR